VSAVITSPKSPYTVWERYRDTRDPALRDQLITQHASLVKYVAGRLAMSLPTSVDVDDLISYGVFGLMDAIDRFEPDRQIKFETYAVSRIRGAMIDGMRAFDWVPYSARQKARDLERVFARLEAKLGRAATDQEVADELGVSVAALSKMLLSVNALSVISLDESWNGESDEAGGIGPAAVIEDPTAENPVEQVELAERTEMLAAAIERLPERERLVISLYYYDGLTAKEISHILKVSQSRVSQLHSRAVLRLRASLGPYLYDLAG